MVARSAALLAASAAVATSPAWLESLAAALFGPNDFQHNLPFSPYLFALPAAVAIVLSWLYELSYAMRPAIAGLSESAERLAAPQPEAPAPRKNSVWRRLEGDFRELREFSLNGELVATWNRASRYGSDVIETWSVSGPLETSGGDKRFAALAETAGRMLIDWPGYKPTLHPTTVHTKNAGDRWLSAIRDLSINTERNAPGEIVGGKDEIIGHSHSGQIRNVVEASIKFCVQIALEEDLEQDLSRHEESLGSQLLGGSSVDPRANT